MKENAKENTVSLCDSFWKKKNYLCCSKQIKKKIIKRKKKVKKSDLTINHDSKSAQLALGYS